MACVVAGRGAGAWKWGISMNSKHRRHVNVGVLTTRHTASPRPPQPTIHSWQTHVDGMNYYIGQRLSLKHQLCTVRYIGPVADKPGEWLGVEWDDPSRGKHGGSHDGTRYFKCRSSSQTAASFLNPKQPWDRPRTFLEALREKYMPEGAGTAAKLVYFSSKQAEEVGFDKFAARQKQLQGIHVVVLDHMRISMGDSQDEGEDITRLCGHVTDLDLGFNLFESVGDILSLIANLPKLKSLTLDGNRLAVPSASTLSVFPGLKTLELSSMLLYWDEIARIAEIFPNVSDLAATQNGLEMIGPQPLPSSLQRLSLSDNSFTSLSSLRSLTACPALTSLTLKRCSISKIWSDAQPSCLSNIIESLDLRNNAISSWAFFNGLELAYPQLNQLQMSGNPLYQDLISAEDKPLTREDGFLLTLARLANLQTLDYSKITEKERLNAERYYLSQIAAELSRTPVEQRNTVLRQHPRWVALCEEYGEPEIEQFLKADDIDPNSLAARLVRISFFVAAHKASGQQIRSWAQDIPKSLSIYALLGVVGKKLGAMPLTLRLVFETNEEDLGHEEASYKGPEWWDSSDEEEALTQHRSPIHREVELVPGTRPVGTYIEGREARVRVEINGD